MPAHSWWRLDRARRRRGGERHRHGYAARRCRHRSGAGDGEWTVQRRDARTSLDWGLRFPERSDAWHDEVIGGAGCEVRELFDGLGARIHPCGVDARLSPHRNDVAGNGWIGARSQATRSVAASRAPGVAAATINTSKPQHAARTRPARALCARDRWIGGGRRCMAARNGAWLHRVSTRPPRPTDD